MSLSSKERASLRAEAHHLSASVHVGHHGLTDTLRQTVDDALRTLMLDPQTSGGLLVGVPAAHAAAWEAARSVHTVSATRIGEVTKGQGVIVTA